jgi:replicative DNA helicase
MSKEKEFKIRPLAEIESQVLGAILLDNSKIEIASKILKPECFLLDANRKIFSTMLNLYDGGIPVDVITLSEQLRKDSLLEMMGGAVYLSKLSLNVSSSANIEFHSKLLYENWYTSEKHSILLYYLRLITNNINVETTFEQTSEIISKLENLGNHISTVKPIRCIGEKLGEALIKIGDRLTNDDADGFKSTSFPTFNRFTGGIRESDFIAVHGDYKQGKTTFAFQIALDLALDYKIPVGVFSLEMSEESLIEKAFSLRTGVDYLKIRSPKTNGMSRSDLIYLQSQVAKKFTTDTPLYILDNVFDKRKIKSDMKYLIKNFGVKIFLVDYISLIVNSDKGERRDLELAELSRYFKLTAKEFKTPIIMLSQSNNEGKVADSKGLARDADFVVYVSKPIEKRISDIKGENEGPINFQEEDFLIQLTHSRHGLNGFVFVCQFKDNKFVEVDYSLDDRPIKTLPVKSYYEKESEEVF